MLDIIHYYFEEDYSQVSEEATARKSALRESLYKTFYDEEYKYPYTKSGASQSQYKSFDPEDYETEVSPEEDVPKPFNPKAQKTKPYTPPTQLTNDTVAPFGSILDAPLR